LPANERPKVARTGAGTRGAVPHRRKISNFLLDKRLQLRYVAFVTLLSAVISGSLGYLIWKQEKDASDTIVDIFDSSELSDDPTLKDEIVGKLTAHETRLVVTMLGAGLGLVIVLSLYMIVMTHKVAGPLYKVSTYFEKMADGRLGEVWNLRKGDMLHGFYEKFREAHDAVRDRHKAENEVVARFLDACGQAGLTAEGDVARKLQRLREHHQRREEQVG
jgi:hypothetical protein